MPFYIFCCQEHGEFEDFRSMEAAILPTPCPLCRRIAVRVWTAPAIKIVSKQRLPLGKGCYGKTVTHQETGGLDIFVPSFGAMEQDEVDYIAQGAVEKERARVKKAQKQGARNETQVKIGAYADLARKAKPGQRAKTIREALKEEVNNGRRQ